MSKLSKTLAKKHLEAKGILKKDVLSYDEKLFVLKHYQEGAENMNGTAGAFFTPWDLATDFLVEVDSAYSLVDLCAGIGMLAFRAYHHLEIGNITCIEYNREYYEVGKKILPEANWVLGNVLDEELIRSIGTFDIAISNPPFGNIKSEKANWLKYKGADFEFKVMEVASRIALRGCFILPQMSTPYRYSGAPGYREEISGKLAAFQKAVPEVIWSFNCGIDTSIYKNDWKGVSPTVEIINTIVKNWEDDPDLDNDLKCVELENLDPDPIEDEKKEEVSPAPYQGTLFGFGVQGKLF